MFLSIAGVILGAVIAIFTTITVENLRKPRLSLQIAPHGDMNYQDRPAKQARFLLVQVLNNPLPKWARWMTRNPATRCHGTITFHHLDGQDYYGRSMQVRWSSSPEPSPLLITLPDKILSIYNPSNLTTRMDIQPGESETIGIAAKFDDDEHCYGWCNDNYFSKPVWRNPDWSLPSGRYLVKVTIISSGDKASEVFRLVNDVSRTDFRLEPKMATDAIYHLTHPR